MHISIAALSIQKVTRLKLPVAGIVRELQKRNQFIR